MTYVVRIQPDGTVTRLDHRLALDAAHEEYTDLDVCILNHPSLPPRMFVAVLSDWGAVDGLPINRKAWALYGRSPLHGVIFVARDDRAPIDDWMIEQWQSDDFAADLNDAMDAWLQQHPNHPEHTVSVIDPVSGEEISRTTSPARRPQ